MKTLGNIIWVLFGGLILCLEYLLSGAFLCITIIGIPFGLKVFKIGLFALWPFGKKVVNTETEVGCVSTAMNVIWFFIGGLLLALQHFVMGLLFCITIIGIPFGKQHFKLAGIAFSPFRREVVKS